MSPGRLRRSSTADRLDAIFTLTIMWLVVIQILPIVTAMVVGMIQGTVVDGPTTPTSEYPAFTVLSFGHVVPSLVLAFLLIRTFTWPARNGEHFGRGDIAWLSLVSCGVLLAGAALDKEILPAWAWSIDGAVALAYVVITGVAGIRMILGRIGLVPAAWRTAPRGRSRPKRTS